MNIKYLSYFVEVVKCGSFTRAAEKLYISQSALSKAVKQLEQELNCILIDRFGKQFRLTNEGKTLYQMGEELLETLKEQEMKIYDSLKNCKGRLLLQRPILHRLSINFEKNIKKWISKLLRQGLMFYKEW